MVKLRRKYDKYHRPMIYKPLRITKSYRNGSRIVVKRAYYYKCYKTRSGSSVYLSEESYWEYE